MRDFINISENLNHGFQTISSIADAGVRQNCCLLFNRMAEQQRGEPELMGGGAIQNPNLFPNGTGIYTYTTEHIGDLTHRMAARFATGKDGNGTFGYEFVHEKVMRSLRHVRSPYGFERDIREQVRSNYRYTIETGKVEDRGLDVWWAELEEAGMRYARAHQKLPVYNEAQWIARQAAIDTGKMNFDRLADHLERLSDMLSSAEAWIEKASLVKLKDEVPMEYRG